MGAEDAVRDIDIREESADALKDYGQVPIAFRVGSWFRPVPVCGGLGGHEDFSFPIEATQKLSLNQTYALPCVLSYSMKK